MNRPALRILAGLMGAFGLTTGCGPAPVSPLPVEMPTPTITSGSPRPGVPASATPSARPSRRASSPAGNPACPGPDTFAVDASDGGPPWPAMCVKVGSILRLEHHGPEGVSVNPADKVSCFYEAGTHECRFLGPGTVRFTIVNEAETRTLTVVVVK